MANQHVINQYFSLLDETLEKLKLNDRPESIYNCDESGICLDPKKELVIAPTGIKHVYSQQSGTRDHVTIHCCVNAAGNSLPPMIIFDKGFPSGALTPVGVHQILCTDLGIYAQCFTGQAISTKNNNSISSRPIGSRTVHTTHHGAQPYSLTYPSKV